MTAAETTASLFRVLAYGGESPGDRSLLEIVVRHLPILLVLVVACVNVGTLIYARTATRDAKIAMRHALGASRWRIVSQLFIEALVLASFAALVGLAGADWALKWGVAAYYSGGGGLMPFWVDPGLRLTTILYAAGLTVLGASILGVLPAVKATGPHVQGQLRNLGAGGSTLRFGKIWTAAMVAQVALTLICIPPAVGISEEAWRDRVIRRQFPADEYLVEPRYAEHGGGRSHCVCRRTRAVPVGRRDLLADVSERRAANARDRPAGSAGRRPFALAGRYLLACARADRERYCRRQLCAPALRGSVGRGEPVNGCQALVGTSLVMLAVGLLACVEPARRALRIQPTDALKEA